MTILFSENGYIIKLLMKIGDDAQKRHVTLNKIVKYGKIKNKI